ncbi:MAG: putative adenosine monophosphate-protein transferase Fic [Motiliproteus sp.]
MVDKYGTGDDPDCYPDSTTLINLLDIKDADLLEDAEREISELTAIEIDFESPPYDLDYLCSIHQTLFEDIYAWAGELRQIDISKGDTRFCVCSRIEPEADKLFVGLANQNYFSDLEYDDLVNALAEFYGDLNVVHPFREGNGRAQRILFEHIVVNCGWEISWDDISADEWIEASIDSYQCDYTSMEAIFHRCLGGMIEADEEL